MKSFITIPVITFLVSCFFFSMAYGYLPPKRVNFELVEIQDEGRVIQGGFFSPDPKVFGKPATGVILVHGVESYWYSGPPMFLGCYLAEQGYAALGYNGVHSGENFRTSEFETAVKEVGIVIKFMKEKGLKNIFLVGHSVGTPIVEYYQGDSQDPAVKAVGLYGPHIDIPGVTRDSLLGHELYAKFLAECRELVAQGKGNEIKLLPYREGRFIITSAKTFLSYRDTETSKAAVERMVKQIKVPVFIVYDPTDNIQGKGAVTKRETIVTQIKENAVSSPKVDILVVSPLPGTSPLEAHSFVKNERFVTQSTVDWLKSVGLSPAPRLKKAK
jgi:pimeloyl-ACP methyl ester carboxylesterase